MSNRFLQHTGARLPLLCGAMYPCSNVELLRATSQAGAVAVAQPLSLVFAHRTDLRTALRSLVQDAGPGAIGFNALIEKSSKVYEDRMRAWIDIALEEGVRFFVTALGNPRWVVDRVHAVGGVVYHDVTERKWAERALEGGVDGLICVSNQAGGHAGHLAPEALFSSMSDLGVPLVGAGGVGDPEAFARLLDVGFEAAQLGTRFIASEECTAHPEYKQAILGAKAQDIVLTRRISGVPVSVIRTAFVDKVGTDAGPIAQRLLQHPKFKHWVRSWYAARSVWKMGRGATRGGGYNDYWQAGRSVEGIHEVLPAAEIVAAFQAEWDQRSPPAAPVSSTA